MFGQNELNTFSGLFQQTGFGGSFGQGLQQQTVTGTNTYYGGQTITIAPVYMSVETYDPKRALQIIYRFGKGLVQSCLIKGTNNIETAKNIFLGQFSGEEPEVVAVVEVEQ